MSTDTEQPSSPSAPTESGPPRSAVRVWATRVLVALAASTTLVWIGAIFWGMFGDVSLPGQMADETFPKAAEPICKTAMADVATFPPAHESATPAERADVIDQSTARLDQMLDDLRAVVPPTSDAKWINMWIDDWGIHLDDRLDFASRLRDKGADEEFFESEKAQTQISKSLNHFAEINDMESCITPGDV